MSKKLPPRSVPRPMTDAERAFVQSPSSLVPQSPGELVPEGTKELVPQFPSSPVEGRGLVPRAGGQIVRRIATYFSPELAKRLGRFCLETDRDMSQVVAAAVDQYLRELGH